MADKPTVQFSLAQIRKDVKKVDVLKMSLSGSKIITFPDVNAMESEESEVLLTKIQGKVSSEMLWPILDEWLSEKDAAALRTEKLTRAELMQVFEMAGGYYRDAYGTAGEDAASASS